ncbi:MAG: glycosyltransferase, partial [Acidobacteriota bacterium]
SPDGTVEIIRRYGDRVRWISAGDRGVYDAMNKGMALSSGRYLYFIGAGDLLRPGVLKRIAAELPAHDRGLVYGNFHLPNDETDYYGEVSKWFLLLVYNICHQSAFYGRGIFELLGEYDLNYRVRADYGINVEAFCDSRIEKRFIDLVIADYEGGGLSELHEDVAFVRDFPALARRCLGVNRLVAPEPLFSFLMRLKFNARFRAFGRRVFQSYSSVKGAM